MELSQLLKIADTSQIDVGFFPLPLNHSASVMDEQGHCYIGMDTALPEDTAAQRVCLAHELGHCLTGSFYNMYSPLDVREKHEHRANAWAIRQLVPKEHLHAKLSRGYTQVWELAEQFGVTEDFMRKALCFYGLLD